MSTKRKHIPRRCAWCQEWTAERVLCRVFPSQGAMEASPYFAGEDLLEGEPNGATRGVWPGKTNAGRSTANWWVCLPSHPRCSGFWEPWEPPEGRSKETIEADESFDRAFARVFGKSTAFETGVWRECTCASEDDDQVVAWTRDYLRSMR